MNPLSSMGRMLIMIGGIILVTGVLPALYDRIPFLGKLPGDFVFRRKDLTVYVPVATSVLLSILVTVLLNIFGRK